MYVGQKYPYTNAESVYHYDRRSFIFMAASSQIELSWKYLTTYECMQILSLSYDVIVCLLS